MARPVDVVVLGAGVVGTSIAYHLAREGARVELLERSEPASGATGASFAWIRRGDEPASPQTELRRLAVDDYRRLEAEVPGLGIRWHGSLSWGEGAAAGRAVGPDELAAIEPHLRTPPPAARQIEEDGAVDPVALTHALLRAATRHGAHTHTGVEVTALHARDDGRVSVETAAETGHTADAVVVATGVAAPALLQPLGYALPVSPSPALLLRFTAPPGLVRTLLSTDEFEVRELRPGELVAAWEYDGETTDGGRRATGNTILGRLERAFGCPGELRLQDVTVGERPMPADGQPVIGWMPGTPGVYVAVMHSGVTLAASVGRLASDEILHGRRDAVLDGLQPARR